MMRPCLMLTALLLASHAHAEDQAIAQRFSEYGLQGTLLLSSLRSARTYSHDDARAEQRFTVASTFKIANTLIALEEGVVADQNAPFEWDGQPHSIAAWNRDQTLRSAFQVSCLWCYRQLATQIGLSRYRHYLGAMHYGQLGEPADLTHFWVNGQLRLSAREQIAFLRQVHGRELPFSAHAYDTLAQVMLTERQARYKLYAKTGLAADTSPQIGWYVGYVETPDDVWFFALNLDIRSEADIPARIALTRQVLEDKGILPGSGD